VDFDADQQRFGNGRQENRSLRTFE
jgi:hypothetical protein